MNEQDKEINEFPEQYYQDKKINELLERYHNVNFLLDTIDKTISDPSNDIENIEHHLASLGIITGIDLAEVLEESERDIELFDFDVPKSVIGSIAGVGSVIGTVCHMREHSYISSKAEKIALEKNEMYKKIIRIHQAFIDRLKEEIQKNSIELQHLQKELQHILKAEDLVESDSTPA